MPDETIYIGRFKDDKFEGKAKLLLNSGIIFEGEFTDGICASIGRLLYSDGETYFGQHKGFMKDGEGKTIILNGSYY